MTFLLWTLRLTFFLIALLVYFYFRYSFAKPFRLFCLFKALQEVITWLLSSQSLSLRWNIEWSLYMIELCWLTYLTIYLCKLCIKTSLVLRLPFPTIVFVSVLNLPFYRTGMEMLFYEIGCLALILVLSFISIILCLKDNYVVFAMALIAMVLGDLTYACAYLNLNWNPQITWIVTEVVGFVALGLAVLNFEPDVDIRNSRILA